MLNTLNLLFECMIIGKNVCALPLVCVCVCRPTLSCVSSIRTHRSVYGEWILQSGERRARIELLKNTLTGLSYINGAHTLLSYFIIASQAYNISSLEIACFFPLLYSSFVLCVSEEARENKGKVLDRLLSSRLRASSLFDQLSS